MLFYEINVPVFCFQSLSHELPINTLKLTPPPSPSACVVSDCALESPGKQRWGNTNYQLMSLPIKFGKFTFVHKFDFFIVIVACKEFN